MSRLDDAFAGIAAANPDDPRSVDVDGEAVPYEELYARRMTARLSSFAPDAPEAVQLAVRAQHVQRWHIPRDSYPKERRGYLAWRKALGAFHAETAALIVARAGYDDEMVARVRSLVGKENLGTDPDVQVLEDTACLVFIEHYLAEFAVERDEAQLVRILKRTWAKMSKAGQARAMEISLPSSLEALLGRALADS